MESGRAALAATLPQAALPGWSVRTYEASSAGCNHAPMLARLIYTSHAPSIGQADIDDLVRSSQAHNQRHDITGALLFLHGTFLQYLEGSQADLQALFERISRDERHCDLVVIDFGWTMSRIFPKWSMGMIEWNDSTRDLLAVFMPRGAQSVDQLRSAEIGPMFRAVASSIG